MAEPGPPHPFRLASWGEPSEKEEGLGDKPQAWGISQPCTLEFSSPIPNPEDSLEEVIGGDRLLQT
jgi:hypothetical protein